MTAEVTWNAAAGRQLKRLMDLNPDKADELRAAFAETSRRMQEVYSWVTIQMSVYGECSVAAARQRAADVIAKYLTPALDAMGPSGRNS